MSCRFPGAPGTAEFWQLLSSGADAVVPAADGRRRGTIDAPADFDAAFFGMSPREAAATDPQQRLVLELGWEALEDAGIVPESLRGEAASVFVGAMNDDYATLLHRAGAPTDTYTATGLQHSMIANRLSYFLGLRGPSLVVDTGQSSSLVAVALAVESLRGGTSGIALAGGVNLVLAEEGSAAMERAGALSPDGRCHTFDARANGYVRGEGGAIVVLKPLADALADGDRVYCVVRGVATGNDGGGPGLTVPDRAGQEAVLRAACDQAGVRPADVRFVELHGTGTPAGDPVEAQALGTVYGTGRPADKPLLVGSVKTNIGHLEGAAGIAGFVKAALCLHERALPASLNFETPNPAIPLERLRLKVQTAHAALEPAPGGEPLLAGVSAFGMGGTNCHVVLEETPGVGQPAGTGRADGCLFSASPMLLLSARSERALREQAARLRKHLEDSGADPLDIAYSLATTRTRFEHRAAVPCGDPDRLSSALAGLAAGQTPRGVRIGSTDADGRLTLLFTGQGAQHPGMGRQLYAADPHFAAALDEVCEELQRCGIEDLREVMFSPDQPDRPGQPDRPDRPGKPGMLDRTEYTQPALFALQTALYRTLTTHGIQAHLVAGHSVGEITAAHIAGVLDLPDAARLITTRAHLMGQLPHGGAMLTVQTSEHHLTDLTHTYGVEIAAVNGPTHCVLSGPRTALQQAAQHLREQNVRHSWLKVSHAFHSALMEPMLGAFRDTLTTLNYQPPTIPLISNLTGQIADPDQLCTPDYWVDHARHTVRFADAIQTAHDQGTTTYLEIGPHPTLTTLLHHTLDNPTTIPTLHRKHPEPETLTQAIAAVGVRTDGIDWAVLSGASRPRRVELPTYAFQRRTHWAPGLTPHHAPAARPAAEPQPAMVAGPVSYEALVRLVGETTASVLGLDGPDEVALDRPFTSQGLDSMTAVELAGLLGTAAGVALDPTLVYELPTPRAVADHLAKTLLGESTADQEVNGRTGQAEAGDPIAVIGIGCRFPGGVTSPDDLWELVASGTDAISTFPTDRGWDLDGLYDPDPSTPGKSYVRHGGFLHDAAQFDAEFFGISPREATAMDPQQRLLLETSWEALERAGVVPESLRGGRTGVFVGTAAPEYGPRLHEGTDGYEGFLLTGTTASVASGRIAYALGTRGPALTVDTACSSSLVALHLAVQSLRRGECDLALAGGTTVMSGPGMFVEFSRQRGLAPDGRCKPFADTADGTAWAEGVGVLLVERLSDAERLGHPVLAVVRGTAVNQDGASNGLTAPSGPAQQQVIREALTDARLTPDDIDAVEAHGTGTPLGDPIEAGALLATYGHPKRQTPLWLGSLKSNIGHTQAAAGIAGIIKMIQALRHNTLPRTLHADHPSTKIDWETGSLRLLADAQPWPADPDRPRRAAVSAFGVSGTNAHAIIEEPPAPAEAPTPTQAPPAVIAWPLSGHSPAALRAQAARLDSWLHHTDANPHDIAHALATTRTHFKHRAVITGRTTTELHTKLHTLNAIQATAHPNPRLTLLFTGQGAQHPGMGHQLYTADPHFAAALDEVCEELQRCGIKNLRDVMFTPDQPDQPDRPGQPGLLDRTEYTQPALFALQTALYRTLTAHGIQAHLVAGHSVGEITAAHIAGVLDLPDAARLITTRAHLMGQLPHGGAMLTVQTSEHHLTDLTDTYGVEIAAVNGPTHCVLSGPRTALQQAAEHLHRQGIRHSWLKVSHAFHSALMEPMLGAFRETLTTLNYQPPTIPLISNLTGQIADPDQLCTPDYWVDHARHTVRFADALQTAHDQGTTTYLEIGPHPTLTTLLHHTLDNPTTIPTLHRKHPE
ncbi:type I polyketide synthase, partial [Streptomyces djakartensis]